MKKIEYFIILVAIILVALFFPMPQGTPPQEIIDQYCTPKGYHWSLYPEINPYYQEIEVGMSGYLTRIQICSEAAEPGGYKGCGPTVTARLDVMKYFDGWRQYTPTQLQQYVIASSQATWNCSTWVNFTFSEHKIHLKEHEKIVILLWCTNWSHTCMQGSNCMVMMCGSGYKGTECGFGFWDRFGTPTWKTWPGERGTDMGFRTCMTPTKPSILQIITSITKQQLSAPSYQQATYNLSCPTCPH